MLIATMASGQVVDVPAVRHAVEWQLGSYPVSTMQDIYKNFYQEHFGPEHMISDVEAARDYLSSELGISGDDACRLYYEPIGIEGNYVRVHLSAVRDGLITASQLLDAFVLSAKATSGSQVPWHDKWQAIVGVIKGMGVKIAGDDELLEQLEKASLNNQAVHHSHAFNDGYHPHYRIVERGIFERELKPLIDR